jgi:hypothetical protein
MDAQTAALQGAHISGVGMIILSFALTKDAMKALSQSESRTLTTQYEQVCTSSNASRGCAVPSTQISVGVQSSPFFLLLHVHGIE